jgi:small subunit ribosomal protein S10e
MNIEGVCVARKDPFGVHAEINVPNLYVMKLMQSLTSKGLVTATFNWSHHYWFLTNTGIEHLREYLGLPEEIVPATLKRKLQARREGGEDRPRGPRFGGKDAAPGEGEFKPTFEGVRAFIPSLLVFFFSFFFFQSPLRELCFLLFFHLQILYL